MIVAAGVAAGLTAMTPARAATTADIIFVVDESGSMAGEHAWLAGMATSLDAELIAKGVTGNRYALTGFGGHVSGQTGHKHLVGGGDWGTAAQLSTATGGLVTSGGTEDGFQAIQFSFDNYAFRPGAAVNVILVTDEDRDVLSGAAGITLASLTAEFAARNALLNAVVDNPFRTAANATALGIDSGDTVYVADGLGGFTTSANGTVGNGAGNTESTYVPLALNSGGAAWDLNQLRAGGATADSFTKAFVDIKVQEVIRQPVPEGGSSLILLGLGIAVVVTATLRHHRALRAPARA